MNDAERRPLIRLASICGGIATVPWIIAAFGWAAHWNVYINLMLTLGGAVIWYSLLAVTMDRYQEASS